MSKTPMDFFKQICTIPHTSGNEKALSDYIKSFAEELGYTCTQDSTANLIVVKPASKGYEKAETVMIQAHIDMVGEAAPGINHNFLTDPIRLVEEDGILRADGTTLGADDGVGTAYMMSILSDKTLKHPRLECVFTTQEETGLTGAARLDTSGLKAAKLINLDAGPEGVLLTTCAGGARALITKDIIAEPAKSPAWELEISGLNGGHSGAEIHSERANALVIAAILADKLCNLGARIVSITGGDKDNVIPAYARLVFCTEQDPKNDIEPLTQSIKQNWLITDPGLSIKLKAADDASCILAKEDAKSLVSLLYSLPHGVVSMSSAIPGLVESSANLASISIENGKAQISMSVRSSSDLRKSCLIRRIELLSAEHNAQIQISSEYPGWAYQPESGLREKCAEIFERMYNTPLSIDGIHAGLECGIFKRAMPNLDIAALGPLYKEMHTPKEWLDMASFNRTYDFLTKILEEI